MYRIDNFTDLWSQRCGDKRIYSLIQEGKPGLNGRCVCHKNGLWNRIGTGNQTECAGGKNGNEQADSNKSPEYTSDPFGADFKRRRRIKTAKTSQPAVILMFTNLIKTVSISFPPYILLPGGVILPLLQGSDFFGQ